MLHTGNAPIMIRDGISLQCMLMYRLAKISIIYRQTVRRK